MNRTDVRIQSHVGTNNKLPYDFLESSVVKLGETCVFSQEQGQLLSAYINSVNNQRDVMFPSGSRYHNFTKPINTALDVARQNAWWYQNNTEPRILNLITAVDGVATRLIVAQSLAEDLTKDETVAMLNSIASYAYTEGDRARHLTRDLRDLECCLRNDRTTMDSLIGQMRVVDKEQSAQIYKLMAQVEKLEGQIYEVQQDLLTPPPENRSARRRRILVGIVAVLNVWAGVGLALSGSSVDVENPDERERRLKTRQGELQRQRTTAYEEQLHLTGEMTIVAGVACGLGTIGSAANDGTNSVDGVANALIILGNDLSAIARDFALGDIESWELRFHLLMAAEAGQGLRAQNSRLRNMVSGTTEASSTRYIWEMGDGVVWRSDPVGWSAAKEVYERAAMLVLDYERRICVGCTPATLPPRTTRPIMV